MKDCNTREFVRHTVMHDVSTRCHEVQNEQEILTPSENLLPKVLTAETEHWVLSTKWTGESWTNGPIKPLQLVDELNSGARSEARPSASLLWNARTIDKATTSWQ